MKDFILYLFQSSVYMGVMYGVYWLLLRKETYFKLNRYYLLLTFLLPLVLPFLPVSFLPIASSTVLSEYLVPVTVFPSRIQATVQHHFGVVESLILVYVAGVTLLALRLIFRLARMRSLGVDKTCLRVNGVRIIITRMDHSPFSFFDKVYFSSENKINEAILSHERVHIREGHTIDVLLAECIKIFQWYNPFVWMTGKSLQSTHEFLADEGALHDGLNRVDYQQLLLRQAWDLQAINLANNFNVSTLKMRMTMMTKQRSASISKLKFMIAILALAGVWMIFTTNLQAQDQEKQGAVKKTESKTKVVPKDETKKGDAFYKVDKMPEFEGGQDAMFKYLQMNIKYPEDAKTKGITGTVYVQFIVTPDGSVTDVKAIKGLEGTCRDEAVRVVKGMPKWKPGEDNGKKVKVYYVLPIKFQLS